MIKEGLNDELYKNYGAVEINGLQDGVKYHAMERETVFFNDITSKDKVELERLRMLTDSYVPFYDISYIYITFNGKPAELLNFPTSQLYKKTWKKELIEICQKNKIFIKGLVDKGNISILY